MVDNRAFDLPFHGRTVKAFPLSETQFVALSLTTKKADVGRSVGRVLRVLESAVGPDEWALIDEELLSGDINLEELTTLLRALIDATVTARAAAPDDDIDTELAAAEARLTELRGLKASG